MKRLIAKKSILYRNKYYERGDVLPIKDSAYCRALVAAGSASWEDDEAAEEPKKKAPKAKALTAPAGVTGLATPATSAEPDLVGRVPSPEARGAAPQPRKKGKKSPK